MKLLNPFIILLKALMKPVPTQEVIPGVYAIRGEFSNLYLIKGQDRFIAIDASDTLNNVKKGLANLNISHESVEAVFLTHSDPDHTAAIPLFENARVYISKDEEQMINGQTVRSNLFFKNKLGSPYQILADLQVINISGIKVQGILTPGHTPGSMSYLINEKYLFTGDTLNLKEHQVRANYRFFNMDTVTEKKSIAKLAQWMGIECVFTAHHGYSDNYKEAFASWKDNNQIQKEISIEIN